MKLFKGRKGLASGIIVIMAVMFTAAFLSILAVIMATQFENTINAVPNESISQDIKDQIAQNTTFMDWGDKLFVMLFLVLLLTYIISSITIPVQHPLYLVLFMVLLIFVCFIAMWLSNSWVYIMQDPLISSAAEQLKFTDYFMRYLPIITFIIGVMGAVIFYGRKRTQFSSGGDISGVE